uniref:Uncharacterized protein n=1 Tax=Daphnia galeata TaxID=27404 RepID=A0A8J2RQH5_9CRUS|nr:unnamed protein product [Daphnia galeata]
MALVPLRWNRDSGNPAHALLEKLFQDGTIEGTTQPKTVYDAHEIFKQYSLSVFRNVFNELKSSTGLLLRKRQAEATVSNEASSSSRGVAKIAKLNEEEGAMAFVNQDSRFNHINQPIVVSVYKDHETEQEKVIILCVLPSGATDIRFRLLGSGPGTILAVVEYSWPPIAFEIEDLFRDEIKKGDMAPCDPKILAFKDDLMFTRQHKDQVPKGSIEISLPIPVQTAANTIKRGGKQRKDGSQAIVVELTAYQSSYTVKPEDEKIVFKMSGE